MYYHSWLNIDSFKKVDIFPCRPPPPKKTPIRSQNFSEDQILFLDSLSKFYFETDPTSPTPTKIGPMLIWLDTFSDLVITLIIPSSTYVSSALHSRHLFSATQFW